MSGSTATAAGRFGQPTLASTPSVAFWWKRDSRLPIRDPVTTSPLFSQRWRPSLGALDRDFYVTLLRALVGGPVGFACILVAAAALSRRLNDRRESLDSLLELGEFSRRNYTACFAHNFGIRRARALGTVVAPKWVTRLAAAPKSPAPPMRWSEAHAGQCARPASACAHDDMAARPAAPPLTRTHAPPHPAYGTCKGVHADAGLGRRSLVQASERSRNRGREGGRRRPLPDAGSAAADGVDEEHRRWSVRWLDEPELHEASDR